MFSSGIVVQYLFVDGAALTAYLADLSKQFCNDAPLEIDFKNSVAISCFKKIFLYDAVPAREDGELEEAYLKRRARRSRSMLRSSMRSLAISCRWRWRRCARAAAWFARASI
jgi:hypothetical protein